MKALVRGIPIIAFLMAVLFIPSQSYAASEPAKVINVVYDDSGSMIYDFDNECKVDTWCQAKYSMEVFAAMLGQKDIMNVYVMSDYYNKTASTPRLTLHGSDGSAANVKKVHALLTDASETPFHSVEKAYSDLVAASGDEKWLVILTDGMFSGIPEEGIDGYFSHKEPSINVMFLGMGPFAESISDYPSQGIFSEKAETSSQILTKVTEICTRIFSMDKLTNISNNQITFDVPMSELTVFAQGEDVQIKGLFGPDGKSAGEAEPVEVIYSEIPTSRSADVYSNPIIDKELRGKIVTFKGDFDAGTYSIDISGAETLEVYYKPNVEIMLFLTDESGKEINYSKGIKEGEYYIDVGFVKSGTTDRVPNSTLLGDVNYDVTILHNGADAGIRYYPNEKIQIEEGNYSINVVADYLKYNTTSAEIGFEVFRDKALEIINDQEKIYSISFGPFDLAKWMKEETVIDPDPNDPIKIQIELEGNPLTADQWRELENLSLNVINKTEQKKFLWIKLNKLYDLEYRLEKSDKIGVFDLYISFPDSYERIDYSKNDIIELEGVHISGNELWSGKSEIEIFVDDNRPSRHLPVIKIVLWILLILLLFLGETLKKRLPKTLKRRPTIVNEQSSIFDDEPDENDDSDKGLTQKNMFTVVFPFVREQAKIKLASYATLKVQASGKSKMLLLNRREFIDDETITHKGSPLGGTEKDSKVYVYVNSTIEITRDNYIHTCFLNK